MGKTTDVQLVQFVSNVRELNSIITLSLNDVEFELGKTFLSEGSLQAMNAFWVECKQTLHFHTCCLLAYM